MVSLNAFPAYLTPKRLGVPHLAMPVTSAQTPVWTLLKATGCCPSRFTHTERAPGSEHAPAPSVPRALSVHQALSVQWHRACPGL